MNISWYVYSHIDAHGLGIEEVLANKGYSLTAISKEENLQQYFAKDGAAVLFIHLQADDAYNMCREISILYPHVYVILVVPEHMGDIRKAMRAGASDMLRAFCSTEEMEAAMEQAAQYMEQRLKRETSYSASILKKKSTVISVCSMKGGVGQTVLAVNMAVVFAKQGWKVAVIDANLQFGDVATYYNIKPKRTIYEWIKEGYGRSSYSIEQYMTKHECDVFILAAPLRPEFFEAITEEHMQSALEECKQIFDIIIIDTPSYLSEIHVSCLEKSDHLLLVTTSDLPALRSSALYIDTLLSLNLQEKIKVILNRDTKKQLLNAKKIEELLNLPVYMALPNHDSSVSSSINTGIPFIVSNARAPITKALFRLVEKLWTGETEGTGHKRRSLLHK